MGAPKGKRVSISLPDSRRWATWESGICPYCGGNKIVSREITKRFHTAGLVTGREYRCEDCGAVNEFT